MRPCVLRAGTREVVGQGVKQMSYRDGRLPAARQIRHLALQSLALGMLCPALFVLEATPSIARADVRELAPSIATASVVATADSQSAACRSLECVRRHVDASTTVRLEG